VLKKADGPAHELVPAPCSCHPVEERAKIPRAFAAEICLEENRDIIFAV
jgi:hypothetical protein